MVWKIRAKKRKVENAYLSWNTRNVAAGFYAVRMQAGGKAFVKRVPIIR
jgi:hypothetical protein